MLMGAIEDVTTDNRSTVREGLSIFDRVRLDALSGPESAQLIMVRRSKSLTAPWRVSSSRLRSRPSASRPRHPGWLWCTRPRGPRWPLGGPGTTRRPMCLRWPCSARCMSCLCRSSAGPTSRCSTASSMKSSYSGNGGQDRLLLKTDRPLPVLDEVVRRARRLDQHSRVVGDLERARDDHRMPRPDRVREHLCLAKSRTRPDRAGLRDPASRPDASNNSKSTGTARTTCGADQPICAGSRDLRSAAMHVDRCRSPAGYGNRQRSAPP